MLLGLVICGFLGLVILSFGFSDFGDVGILLFVVFLIWWFVLGVCSL